MSVKSHSAGGSGEVAFLRRGVDREENAGEKEHGKDDGVGQRIGRLLIARERRDDEAQRQKRQRSDDHDDVDADEAAVDLEIEEQHAE